jgi:hypothetical protein
MNTKLESLTSGLFEPLDLGQSAMVLGGLAELEPAFTVVCTKNIGTTVY